MTQLILFNIIITLTKILTFWQHLLALLPQYCSYILAIHYSNIAAISFFVCKLVLRQYCQKGVAAILLQIMTKILIFWQHLPALLLQYCGYIVFRMLISFASILPERGCRNIAANHDQNIFLLATSSGIIAAILRQYRFSYVSQI